MLKSRFKLYIYQQQLEVLGDKGISSDLFFWWTDSSLKQNNQFKQKHWANYSIRCIYHNLVKVILVFSRKNFQVELKKQTLENFR